MVSQSQGAILGTIFFPTALVTIHSSTGQTITARWLLNCSFQRKFVSAARCEKLQLFLMSINGRSRSTSISLILFGTTDNVTETSTSSLAPNTSFVFYVTVESLSTRICLCCRTPNSAGLSRVNSCSWVKSTIRTSSGRGELLIQMDDNWYNATQRFYALELQRFPMNDALILDTFFLITLCSR